MAKAGFPVGKGKYPLVILLMVCLLILLPACSPPGTGRGELEGAPAEGGQGEEKGDLPASGPEVGGPEAGEEKDLSLALFRANPSRTGVFAQDGCREFTELWRLETGDPVYASPAVTEEMVYFGGLNGIFYGVDGKTGATRWSYQADNAIRSSPWLEGGVVYFGTHGGKVFALDGKTGEERWVFAVDSVPSSPADVAVESSPVVAGGLVYFGSFNGSVYALDAATGEQVWEFKTGGAVGSSPCVADGVVYIGSYDKKVYALDAATGKELWHFATRDSVYSTPACHEGMVYFGSLDGNFYGVAAATGQEVWRFPTAGTLVWSSPAVEGETVYFGAYDANLYALDAKTGEIKWRFWRQKAFYSSPAIAGDLVYIGCNDGKVYGVDKEKELCWASLPPGTTWKLHRCPLAASSILVAATGISMPVGEKIIWPSGPTGRCMLCFWSVPACSASIPATTGDPLPAEILGLFREGKAIPVCPEQLGVCHAPTPG